MAIKAKLGVVSLLFQANTKQLEKSLNKIKKRIDSAGKSMQSAGRSLVVGGAALGAPLILAAKNAAMFEREMSKVATLDVANLNSLSDGMKRISEEFGIDATENVRNLYDTISAGVPEDAAIFVLEAAAKGATAGVGELGDALDLGTSIMNAYGKEASDFESIMGQAVTAIKFGKTNMTDLGGAVGQAAGLMAKAGISSQEFLANIAALTTTGLSAAESVTALKSIVTSVLKPTVEAAAAAQQLGVDFSASALKAKGLAAFLGEMQKATGGSAEQMAKLFGNVRALNGALQLADELAPTAAAAMGDMVRDIDNLEGAYQRAIDADPTLKWREWKEKAKNLGAAIGEQILPRLDGFREKGVELTDKLKELVEQNEELTGKLGVTALGFSGLAITVGGNLLVFGALAFSITSIIGFLVLIKVPLLAVAAFIGILATAAETLAFWLLAIAAAGGAGFLFGKWLDSMLRKIPGLADKLDWLGEKIFNVWQWMTGLFSAADDTETLAQQSARFRERRMALGLLGPEQKAIFDEEQRQRLNEELFGGIDPRRFPFLFPPDDGLPSPPSQRQYPPGTEEPPGRFEPFDTNQTGGIQGGAQQGGGITIGEVHFHQTDGEDPETFGMRVLRAINDFAETGDGSMSMQKSKA